MESMITAAEQCLEVDDYERALMFYDSALGECEQSCEEAMLVHHFIGLVHLELEQIDKVEASFAKCIEIAKTLFGTKSIRYATVFADQARAYSTAGSQTLAQEKLFECFNCIASSCSPGDDSVEWNWEILVSMYEQFGDWKLASFDHSESVYSYRAAYEAASSIESFPELAKARIYQKYVSSAHGKDPLCKASPEVDRESTSEGTSAVAGQVVYVDFTNRETAVETPTAEVTSVLKDDQGSDLNSPTKFDEYD